MSKKRTIFIFVLILAFAAFLRFWQIESAPPGIYPDEAINANQALEAWQTKDFPIFYPDNNGREGLYMNIIGLMFGIFGVSIFSFKLVSMLLGTLTILGQFLLTKEVVLFLSRKVRATKDKIRDANIIALLSSFFLAASFWHINFSRIGFRAIMTPFVMVFAFYFLFLGIRTRKLRYFIFGGLAFGLGFHTYIGFRLAVLPLFFLLLLWLIITKKEQLLRFGIISSTAFLIATFIVGLPIGLYFLGNPDYFIGRASGVSVTTQENPLFALVESTVKHLGMFHFAGDYNWRHNAAGSPQLFFPVAFFFLAGVIYAFARAIASFRRIIKQFSKNDYLFSLKELGGYKFLFVWFFALMLPGMLTYEGIPHALRVLGVIPVLYIFAAIGAYIILQWFYRFFENKSSGNLFFFSLIGILALWIASFSYYQYFIYWAPREEVKEAFTHRFVNVGFYLNNLPSDTSVYILKSEGDLPVETTTFIDRTDDIVIGTYLETQEAQTYAFQQGDRIVTMNDNREQLDPIMQRYGSTYLQKVENFWVLHIQ